VQMRCGAVEISARMRHCQATQSAHHGFAVFELLIPGDELLIPGDELLVFVQLDVEVVLHVIILGVQVLQLRLRLEAGLTASQNSWSPSNALVVTDWAQALACEGV